MGRRKNFFYLTMHSTHFIYGYMASDMVKDHPDSERGNPLAPHGILFPISSKGSFIWSHRQDNTYHDLWYTNCGALAKTRNSSVGKEWESWRLMHGHEKILQWLTDENRSHTRHAWTGWLYHWTMLCLYCFTSIALSTWTVFSLGFSDRCVPHVRHLM